MQYQNNPVNGCRDIVRKRNTAARPDMLLTMGAGDKKSNCALAVARGGYKYYWLFNNKLKYVLSTFIITALVVQKISRRILDSVYKWKQYTKQFQR